MEGKAGGFVELAGVEGCILGKFKKEYLFVKTARAPNEWVQGFVYLFSAVKIEVENMLVMNHTYIIITGYKMIK